MKELHILRGVQFQILTSDVYLCYAYYDDGAVEVIVRMTKECGYRTLYQEELG